MFHRSIAKRSRRFSRCTLTTTSSPVRSTARCTCQVRVARWHEHALDDLLAGAQPGAPAPGIERCHQYLMTDAISAHQRSSGIGSHLGKRGRGERLRVEALEELIDIKSELVLDDLECSLCGEAWHLVLQLAQLFKHLIGKQSEGQSEVIRGHQLFKHLIGKQSEGQSEALRNTIRGHQRPSEAIGGTQRRHQRPSEALRGPQRPSEAPAAR